MAVFWKRKKQRRIKVNFLMFIMHMYLWYFMSYFYRVSLFLLSIQTVRLKFRFVCKIALQVGKQQFFPYKYTFRYIRVFVIVLPETVCFVLLCFAEDHRQPSATMTSLSNETWLSNSTATSYNATSIYISPATEFWEYVRLSEIT